MLAKNVMVTNIVTAHADETLDQVLERMRKAKLRMIPVLDAHEKVVGVVSTFSVMEKVVPSYITTGDLNQISYAPDIGVLLRHYNEISKMKVTEVIDEDPLIVSKDESLLSVAAAMVSYNKHEYAMVVDKNKCLLGVVSAGDILDRMKRGGEDA